MRQSDAKDRKTNIELLRIIAMFMVIMLHALGHGGILPAYEFGTFGYVLFNFIEVICCVAVNIFVLITGYFMVYMQMRLSRIIRFIIQVEFFSLLCLLISTNVFHVKVTWKDIVFAIFPLTGNEYWFASAYVILLTLIPLINHLIHCMNKAELIMATLLLIFMFSVITTFFPWSRSRGWTTGYDFIWFVVLYFIGACFRLCGGRGINILRGTIVFAVLSGIHFLIGLLIEYIRKRLLGYEAGGNIVISYCSLMVLMASVSLFCVFLQMKLKKVNIIVALGKLSFGAYLCSDHKLIREPLWGAFDITGRTASILGNILYACGIVIFIFAIGCLVEWMRLKFMQVLRIEELIQKIDLKFEFFKNQVEEGINNSV